MQAASGRYLLAAAALAATSAVVAVPLASRPSQLPIRSIETRLVDAGSVLNIPINLFDDILNIPANEITALNATAGSEFFTGSWWVPGPTNIWGIDPGDPTHVALVTDLLAPFPGLNDGVGGLQYQIDGLLAAELPVSASCDAMTCAPITPPPVITGDTSYDRAIEFLQTIDGQQSFGLFDNWFKVPLSDLFSGYTFNSSNDPGIVDPSGAAFLDGFVNSNGNPFVGATGPGDTMPWDGVTYTLNPLQPFVNFYDSLLQTPSGGIAGTGIDIPTFTDITQAFQNLAAGTIIDFDPFTAGSPACPATCDIPASLQIPGLVQDIENLDPTNTTIQTWLTDFAADPTSVNEPSQSEINAAVALLQTGSYNFSPTELAQVDQALANINPELPALLTNGGILTDPNYLTYLTDPSSVTNPTTGVLESVYGGYNPWLEGNDLLILLQDAGSNPVDPTLLTDLNTVLTDTSFPGDPSALAALFGDSAASTAGAVDPTGLSTDLSTLLASMGTTAGSDLLSQLTAELSAQLTADLATVLPSSILSLF
jgi:hypothetical protein